MLNLLPILIVPLITYLSVFTDDFPSIEPQLRCVVILTEKSDNGFNGYCRCHLYQWGSGGIGRISESTNYPIEKCDRLVGFSAESNSIIYTWQESIRLWLKRHQEKK